VITEEKDLRAGELPVNKIVWGNALTVLKKLPSNSVDCVITSPPYWGKRDYGDEVRSIFGGSPYCDHEWVELYSEKLKMSVSNKSTLEGYTGDHVKIRNMDGHIEWLVCRKCGAHYGQLGLEPTPMMFVDHLIEIFREIKRVLKPHGNVFVVIDDTYSGSGSWSGGGGRKYKEGEWEREWVKDITIPKPPTAKFRGAPRKSLCLVPELFAIRMVYEEGWILRNKIIWPKKVFIYKERRTIGNALPESVSDRLCHTWEYVYHFVKEPKYYYDLDAVRVPHKEASIKRDSLGYKTSPMKGRYQVPWEKRDGTNDQSFLHPLGANPGDVVQINIEPLKESHYAPFPTKLVEFLIKLGCPEQICKKCGKPRERIVEVRINEDRVPDKWKKTYRGKVELEGSLVKRSVSELYKEALSKERYTVGWTDCGCKLENKWQPGIVLDPFLGSGTTALVALKMGRRFVGIEINRGYCEMALKRIKPYLTQQRLMAWL
jgi:DNA modification methylase